MLRESREDVKAMRGALMRFNGHWRVHETSDDIENSAGSYRNRVFFLSEVMRHFYEQAESSVLCIEMVTCMRQ